jgi:hypothetical protein
MSQLGRELGERVDCVGDRLRLSPGGPLESGHSSVSQPNPIPCHIMGQIGLTFTDVCGQHLTTEQSKLWDFKKPRPIGFTSRSQLHLTGRSCWGPGRAIQELVPVSISITGQQDGFVVRQTFKHGAPAPQDRTDIYQPLFHILDPGRVGVGLRQVFVLRDGEVSDTDRVIQLALSNRWNSRIFTIGIGGGADAGLVEGLANVTGGRSDFVVSGEDVSSKVILQLQTSLSGLLTEVSVHVAEDSSIDIAPFPILPISECVSSTVFVKLSEPIENRTGVLLSGDYCGDRQDFVIESRPARIDTTLLYSLYAYEALRCLERDV